MLVAHLAQQRVEALGQRLGDVPALGEGGLGGLGPLAQGALRLGQQRARVVQQPVVGQGDARGPPLGEAPEGAQGQRQVEVGRRGGGPQHAAVGQLHPHGVAGEQDPALRVVQAHVVLGVARRVHRHQLAAPAEVNDLVVLQGVQPLGRRRVEPAVEGVEERPVDPGRRVHQAGGVGQVAGPRRVHVHGGRRESPGHVAHPAGVVQVDVGHHHPGQIGRPEPQAGQRGQQHRHRRLAARLHQHRPRPLHEVAGGDPLPAAEQGVDLQHPRPDAPRLGHLGPGPGGVMVAPRSVTVAGGHGAATSTTTFTSSGWRARASCQRPRGTRRLTRRSSHDRSAAARAAAPAS